MTIFRVENIKQLRAENSELRAEAERLRIAIREHKNQRGDDRCWLDDSKLYSVLDERDYDSSLPPKCAFLESCARFWEQRQTPEAKDRRAGEMTIAQLQAEVERLREEAAERELILAGCEAMIRDLRVERDKLVAAVRQADEFLAEVVAYGLARREKGEIRKAFREALAGLDPAPTDEGG